MTEIKKINDRDGSRQEMRDIAIAGDVLAPTIKVRRHFITNGSDEGLIELFEGLDRRIMTWIHAA